MESPKNCPTLPNGSRATSGSNSASLSPVAAPLALPIPPTHKETLDAFGRDNLLQLISNGNTHAQIARLLAVDAGALSAYLDQGPDRQLYALAYRQSAEAFMDQAEEIIDSGDPETITAAQVAYLKLKADMRMRRAGQRNARYREKAPADDGQPTAPPAAPPSFVLVVHGSAQIEARPGATYDHEGDG